MARKGDTRRAHLTTLSFLRRLFFLPMAKKKKDGNLVWEFEIVSADEGARMDVDIDANSGELLSSEPDGKQGKHGKKGKGGHDQRN